MSRPASPQNADPAARAAFKRALAAMEAMGEDVSLSVEPLRAYARACSDVALLRQQWGEDGQPLIARSANGQPIPHPYLGMIERAERWAAECAATLALDPQARRKLSRSVGRPAGAASAPDRAQPPRRRLKAAA